MMPRWAYIVIGVAVLVIGLGIFLLRPGGSDGPDCPKGMTTTTTTDRLSITVTCGP